MIPARVRRQQPRGPVAVARTPLANGLVFLWNGTNPTNAVVGGRATASNLNQGRRLFSTIESPELAGAQDVRWNRSVLGSNPAEGTLFALCSVDTQADAQTVLSLSNSGDTNPLFRLGFAAGSILGWYVQFRGSTTFANVDVGGLGISPAGKLTFIVGVYRTGTGQKEIWQDGILRRTDTTNVGTIALDQTEVGTLVRSAAGQWFDGPIALAGVYNRALSAAEIVELTNNPWQLFRSRQSRTFFPVASSAVYTLTADYGAFTNSGQTASLLYSRLLSADYGAFTLSGQAVNLLKSSLLTADYGAFTLTGQDAALAKSVVLTADYGSFTHSGQDTSLLYSRLLSADNGSFVLNGQDAVLARNITLTADYGAFTLNGQDTSLFKSRVLTADYGAFTLTGQDASLFLNRLLAADYGAFTLNGQDATLTYNVPTQYILTADYGPFTLNGQDTTLLKHSVIPCAYGSFTLNGQDAVIGRNLALTADGGSFTLGGQDATLNLTRAIVAEYGAFVLSGQAVLFDYSNAAAFIIRTVSLSDAVLNSAVLADSSLNSVTLSDGVVDE